MHHVLKIIWKCKSTTIEPATGTCRSGSTACNNGVCIPLSWRCDGKSDCLSGEDELQCPMVCGSDKFQCVSGKCIELSMQCDGNNDCSDADDELNCITVVYKSNQSMSCVDMKGYDIAVNQALLKADRKLKELRRHLREVSGLCGGKSDFNDTELLLWMKKMENYLNLKILDTQVNMENILSKILNEIHINITILFEQRIITIQKTIEDIVNKTITSLKKKLINKIDESCNTTMQTTPKMQPTTTIPCPSTTTALPSPSPTMVLPSPLPTTTLPNPSPHTVLPTASPQEMLENLTQISKLLQPPYTEAFNSTSCPPGFSQDSSNCYYVEEQIATFANARLHCRYWGAYLVTIESQKEHDYFMSFKQTVKNNVDQKVLTGGNDILVEGEFVWEATGKPFTYTYWNKSPYIDPSPDGVYDENCVAFNDVTSATKGRIGWNGWYDYSCTGTFLCERNFTKEKEVVSNPVNETVEDFILRLKDFQNTLEIFAPKQPVDSATSCPKNFIKKNKSCYHVFSEEVTWFIASAVCKDYEGWLVDISDSNKHIDSIDLINNHILHPCTFYWVGLLGMKNEYFTDKNFSPYSPISNFDVDTLVSVQDKVHCVTIEKQWGSRIRYQLRDIACSTPHCFICEVPPSV